MEPNPPVLLTCKRSIVSEMAFPRRFKPRFRSLHPPHSSTYPPVTMRIPSATASPSPAARHRALIFPTGDGHGPLRQPSRVH